MLLSPTNPVTKHALPPNEDWNRETVIKAISGSPHKILDLGCGTGSTTLLVQKAFSQRQSYRTRFIATNVGDV